MNDVRCPECGKKIGERAFGYFRARCPRCRAEIMILAAGTLNVEQDGKTVRITVDIEHVRAMQPRVA